MVPVAGFEPRDFISITDNLYHIYFTYANKYDLVKNHYLT